VLRHKEPGMFRPYRAPAFPWLPGFVAVLAAFAGYLFVRVNVQVLVPTILLYVAAAVWYVVWARRHVLTTAPEEVATRIAEKIAQRERVNQTETIQPGPPRGRLIERATGVVLFIGILSLAWMVARSSNLIPGNPTPREVGIVTAVWVILFVLVSSVGFFSTSRADKSDTRKISASSAR
jgi:uncharacterized membrane protein